MAAPLMVVNRPRAGWWLAAALVTLVLLYTYSSQLQQVQVLPYSEFLRELENHNVSDLAIFPDHLEGVLSQSSGNGRARFVTTRVEPGLASDLARYGVRFTGMVPNTLLRDLLSWVAPTLIFVGVWMFAVRRMGERGGLGGGLLQIGKSHARVFVESDTQVTFDDVAGVDEAKEELHEIVDFLKDPAAYGRLGAHIPKGILLVGPPGTGKTLLARAVAGQAGVPFFSINGSEFVEMFVGVGAARVRDLFEQARLRAPAIIFIDEIDALGRARGAYGLGGHDEKEQTLNQLLAELDGFDPTGGLVLLAATNRPEILDPALLRAGRFDRQVLVDRPDRRGRVQILRVHLKRIKRLEGVDPEQIAALTPGFSGADLANLVNEAALMATRRQAQAVGLNDFTLAIERIVAGLEKRNRILNPQERRIIATHEMGHALVALSLPGLDTVHKVSIIPRGVGALGYTIQRPTEDRYLMTRLELEHKMAMLMGGRAAEMLVMGHASTGASDDLVRATDIARSMVLRFGMDPTLGLVALESQQPTLLTPLPDGLPVPLGSSPLYSQQTAREVDCAVRQLVEAAFERATGLLSARRSALDAGSRLLLERETLSEEDIQALMAPANAAVLAAAETVSTATPSP